jgi:hypothetical protein
LGTLAALRRVATTERIGSAIHIEGSRLSDREVEHLLAFYRELKVSEEARLAAYRRFFEDALSAELLQRLSDCVNGGFVLDTAKFERQFAAMLGRRIA